MSTERKSYMVSAIFQTIIIIIKLLFGTLFGCYTLIASGYNTLTNYINDFVSLIFAKIENRRMFKRYPFGLGKNEYYVQIVLGTIIIILGIIIVIKSIMHTYSSINLNIIYFIILIIFLQFLCTNYLFKKGISIRSKMLNITSMETYDDLIQSFVLLLVIIASYFIPLIDLIGSILIALLIIIRGITTIKYALFGLFGESKENSRIRNFIKKTINNVELVEYSDSEIIKYQKYCLVSIEIAIDDNIDINKLYVLEKQLKKTIKNGKYNIVLIDFNVISR